MLKALLLTCALALMPALACADLAGQVVDQEGKPVPGAEVLVWQQFAIDLGEPAAGVEQPQALRTGADGRFVLAGEAKRALVYATAPGYAFAVWHAGVLPLYLRDQPCVLRLEPDRPWPEWGSRNAWFGPMPRAASAWRGRRRGRSSSW